MNPHLLYDRTDLIYGSAQTFIPLIGIMEHVSPDNMTANDGHIEEKIFNGRSMKST